MMDYVRFGTAGVKVSRLALGLGLRGQADEAAAQRLVEHAIDSGITLLDCANIYGPMDDRANIGRSEVVLGKALQGKRDQVVITSKVASAVGTGPNDRGLSRYHILREIEGTLRRLQTDHVDIYLVHTYDSETPLEETVRALDDVVRSGKARYVGCCNYAAWQVCRALWVADTANAHCRYVRAEPLQPAESTARRGDVRPGTRSRAGRDGLQPAGRGPAGRRLPARPAAACGDTLGQRPPG